MEYRNLESRPSRMSIPPHSQSVRLASFRQKHLASLPENWVRSVIPPLQPSARPKIGFVSQKCSPTLTAHPQYAKRTQSHFRTLSPPNPMQTQAWLIL